MNFIRNLLSDNSKVSSKRFISLFCLGLFTVVVIAILGGVVVPSELIYSLAAMITGNAALTMIPTNSNITKNFDPNEKY